MEKKDLNKSMYQAVKKALGSKQGNSHAANHIAQDIIDPNMVAQTPKDHIPAAKEGVLHKDVSVSEMHQQKQANAQAAVGMPPKAPSMKKMPYGAMMVSEQEGMETPENGIGKLRKFMEKCSMKKGSKSFDRASHKDIKGVHTSGGFSGLEEEGRSQAGNEITSRAPKAGNQYLKEMHHERGKQMHREKIDELKAMPKPNLPKSEEMAKAKYDSKLSEKGKEGRREKNKAPISNKFSPDSFPKGVHTASDGVGGHYKRHSWGEKVKDKNLGSSGAGQLVRYWGAPEPKKTMFGMGKPKREPQHQFAIDRHKQNIEELRSMPKPNLPKSEMAKTVPTEIKNVRRKAASKEEEKRGVPRYKTNPDGKSTGPNRPNEGHHFGINHPWKDKEGSGESVMGHKVRNPDQWYSSAKEDAKSKIKYLKDAPKPNLPKSEKAK